MKLKESRVIVNILFFILITVLLSACAKSSTTEEKTEEKETETIDDGMVSVPKEKAEFLEEHAELVEFVEKEDYASAETYIHDLLLKQKQEAAGDIADYLVTVDLNSDNFEEYFEMVKIPKYNAFGERDMYVALGVKSKKYDEGLIIYSLDDISVEYTYDNFTTDVGLSRLLSLNGNAYDDQEKEEEFIYTGRITDGKVTFIKQEYIDDYPIPELEKPDHYNENITIQLKNGETISRDICPDYPF